MRTTRDRIHTIFKEKDITSERKIASSYLKNDGAQSNGNQVALAISNSHLFQ